MTNDLAIRIITGDVLGTSEQTQEAITMAVKALSMPSAQPEIIRCKDCKHRPVTNTDYDYDKRDLCGLDIEFPDYRCPCQCDDAYYNRLPDDDWFCGNAERRTG